MPRQFNTAHANRPHQHYTLPAFDRLPPDIVDLVADGYYFVLHAPRQSGKTTSMMALADKLRLDGHYAVVFATVEAARTAHTEERVVAVVVRVLCLAAQAQLAEAECPPAELPADAADSGTRLYALLRKWSQACPRPLVLLVDEIDCLQDEGLVSVLSQFRMGYAERPKAFPHSVCIFGMRDVRDYKVRSRGSAVLGTTSPFNIKRESLTVANFSLADITALYGQHTAETGQVFTEAALDRAWQLSQGQPYLVNALADNVVRKQRWSGPIDAPQIEVAKEQIILEWGTHFDSLMAILRDDRVRRVIQPIMAGTVDPTVPWEDDRFCRDLGLITGKPPQLSNPIYREVIPRFLTRGHQLAMEAYPGRWHTADGRLDIAALRQSLLAFWREHAEGFVKVEDYHEVAAQLVVMAFLQRVVNGGGQILREYAAGSGRIDILIKWPVADAQGKVDLYGDHFEHHLWELKVWADKHKAADPKGEALVQLGEYMARVPCDSATLVIFDRRAAALQVAWEDRVRVEDDAPVVHGVGVVVVRG